MISYFPKYFSNKSIVLFYLLLGISVILFRKIINLDFLFFSITTSHLFFYQVNKLSKSWYNLPEKIFKKKVLLISIAIRVFIVFFLYIYFQIVNGNSFEFAAADSIGYHGEALWIVDLIHADKFSTYFDYVGTNYSDMGYPLYLAFIYFFTGKSIIIARIIKALLGAYTCIMVYQIARRNFGLATGRLAGILAMLLPNMVYYCGLHTKETELVFLTVAFINQAEILIRSNSFSLKRVLITLILGLLLFFFRTVLGAAAFFSLIIALVFSSKRFIKMSQRLLTFFWLITFIILFSGSAIMSELSKYWEAKDANQESQMQNFATRQSGNQLAKYGKSALFVPVILVAPFPTLVNIEGQDNQMMLAGAYFTRNIYAFFLIIALLWLIQQNRYRNHLLILTLTGSYLFILSMSGFVFSERFHMPVVPFLVILAAFGITKINKKNKRFFVPYIIVISIIILGWNWFKLAGRGMI